jgi:hypothetical protein
MPQADLFRQGTEDLPRWEVLVDPSERLAAFATDGGNPPAKRREAEGVLALYQLRMSDFERRNSVEVAEPTVLGLLMLVPKNRVE